MQDIGSHIPGQPGSTVHQLLIGAISGLVATVPMTLVMILLYYTILPGREQYRLPPRQITDRLLNRTKIGRRKANKPEQRRALTWLSHFGYGGGTGSLYPFTVGKLPLPPILSGMIFGLAVWLVSYLGWLPAADILPPATRQPKDRNILMILSHLAWGSVIGFLSKNLEKTYGSTNG